MNIDTNVYSEITQSKKNYLVLVSYELGSRDIVVCDQQEALQYKEMAESGMTAVMSVTIYLRLPE